MGIGPSTKETSLHHFRDPLLDVVSKDTDVDLMGVMLVGSPDGNEDKMLVGTRAAVWAECMRADGVILSCDGWGNMSIIQIQRNRSAHEEYRLQGLLLMVQ